MGMQQAIPENILAYIAGIVDGEGCIHIHKKLQAPPSRPQQRSPYYRLSLKVKMTHKPVVEFLAQTMGAGTIYSEKPGKLNKKVAWSWVTGANDAVMVLTALLPYLRVKTAEARLALEFATANQRVPGNGRVPIEVSAYRHSLYEAMRELKRCEWSSSTT